MKRKLKGVLGIGLTLVMVLSLMVAFAPVATAADYEENDWGEWGLPDTEPDTDVGPIAVAPDGTLYAAVGPTSYNVEFKTGGTSGTAAFSGDEAYSGNNSVDLSVPSGTADYGAVNLYCDPIPLSSLTGDPTFLAHGVVEGTPWNSGPYLNILLDTDSDGTYDDALEGLVATSSDGYAAGWHEMAGGGYYDSDDSLGVNSYDGELNPANLTYWQGIAPDATVVGVQIMLGWSSHTTDGQTVYVDDVTVNGLTYDLEGLDEAGGALLGFGSKLQMSDDDGYTWDDTDLDAATSPIVDIAISPNYEEDETVYVGCADGTVYRVEEAGDDAKKLKTIRDTDGTDATRLYSIDAWYSDDLGYNLILVGTDVDVLLLEDMVTGFWIDQELDGPGYEVKFAPDFEDEEVIWAITDNPSNGDFVITSTIAPGRWGEEIGPAEIDDVTANAWVDLAFPDDYTSDPDETPTVFAAISSDDDGEGGVYMVEGVESPDDSVATQLMDNENIVSIAVSGDAGDAFILAGSLDSNVIYYSDDGGNSWDDVSKDPTGEGMTYVIMEADVVWGGEVFDPDDGMAFASTFGNESAVSRSNDGGMVWNQIGLVDTDIDGIDDLAFHPDFPDTATFMMLTDDGAGAYSLWLTENGDSDEPDYMRVLCGYDGGTPGNIDAEEISLVEYAQDGDAIYIFGESDSNYSIWKSTNDGQTFGSKRSVKDDAEIYDWAIPDSKTIYAATDKDGFYMTINSGLSWSKRDTDGDMNDIALSPNFEDDETILLGGYAGEVLISDDGGDSWDNTNAGLDGSVYVAFDPDYADEDSDGFSLIYACDDEGDNAILVAEADADDTEWDALEDDTNDSGVVGYFYGLQVSADRALYAIADDADYDGDVGDFTGKTGVVRLLLDESDSLWENATDSTLTSPRGLWLSTGSNVLWTIDGNELWVLEDTLSGQVTLDSPKDGAKLDREDVARISWKALRGADDDYEYRLNETSGLGMDIGTTSDPLYTDATAINVEVDSSSEYDWKVRVAPGEPWHSRWSDTRTFNTALGAPPWSPTLYTPGGEWQYSGLDVELMPAFSWQSAKNADGYQFVLADNAEFASPLVDEKVPESAYNLDFELEYNTNYFWKVMAYNGSKAISRWSDVGAFTTITKEVPSPSPAPPATVTQPAPAPVVIPTPIPPVLLWTIIGIGALLIIAVIVLIVRTRRAV